MIAKKGNENDALSRLTNILVDDILETSDEDILNEFKETYGDANQYAVTMLARFEKAIIATNKKHLLEAKAGVRSQQNFAKLSLLDINEARKKLHCILDSFSNENKLVTLAARKETELSDSDVLSMLQDLEELGMLPIENNK